MQGPYRTSAKPPERRERWWRSQVLFNSIIVCLMFTVYVFMSVGILTR